MAIQKINLGTEPLGEGGDTYRSANTKINENFSNTTHAASRLVGAEKGQVPLSENVAKAYLTTLDNFTTSGYSSIDDLPAGTKVLVRVADNQAMPISGLEWHITTDRQGGHPDDRRQIAWTNPSATRSLSYTRRYIIRNKAWSDWYIEYSSSSTTKDSNTNLLLETGTSIPSNSAASKLVGDEVGRVPIVSTYGIMNTGIGGKGRFGIPTVEDGNVENLAGGYFYRPNADRPDDPDMAYLGTWDNSGIVIPNRNTGHGGLLYFPSQIQNTKQNILFYQVAKTGDTYTKYYHVFYTSRNTNKGTNGALSAKSPVTHLYHNRVEHTGNEKELQPIEFIKKGVGDYLLKNTTGLAQEGWYIVIPQDANGNPLIAVEYDDNDGDVNVRTYKRKFDYEQAKVVADHDNPMDIPETRWIDLRFNDDPSLYDEEQLYAPDTVDEPIVEEEVEPEVVEEPSEESK